MTSISIIVCTYNREQFIYRTLACIARNSLPQIHYQIILINNNSTDRTIQEVERFRKDFPNSPLKYFEETAQGLSFARNRGIEESSGEWLIFLDDDSFVPPHYLENILKNLLNHPDADAFGGKIIPCFEEHNAPAWLCKWNRSWLSALDLGSRVRLFAVRDYPFGANMGIKRTCFEQCGGFNVELGRSKDNLLGGEEKDFFERLGSLGCRVYYFPDIPVSHIIPPHRTTKEFIKKLALGVGRSERIRTLSKSRIIFAKRAAEEIVKWLVGLVLFLLYTCKLQPTKGYMLLLFRYHVSKALLKAKNCELIRSAY